MYTFVLLFNCFYYYFKSETESDDNDDNQLPSNALKDSAQSSKNCLAQNVNIVEPHNGEVKIYKK